jgi:spermidine/putrescine transport system ATP-binding protein
VLEVIGITKEFSGKRAVHQIDLTVGDGEFLSILGPSGCGKTTLLRLVAGLEKADQGVLKLNGQDITRLAAHKRNVHTVFQRYALFPHMSVYDNVAFGLRCKKLDEGEIKKRVEEGLELANLKGQGPRAVTTLSGGEQQRVALVRALVNFPKLLLLDEPLGALDLKLRLQLQQELVTIQKRVRTTFVFVTHDQQEALNMSDRVAVMNKGRIEQVGTPNEIYEFPKTFFVAGFVGLINRLDGTLRIDEAGRCLCDVEGAGSFFIDPPQELRSAGVKGALCIRPEKLTLFSRKPTTVENVVEGVIKAQSYLGTHTQFEVTAKNGQSLTVFQQNTQKLAKKAFQAGDRVYLGWQTHLSHFFQEPGVTS